MGAECAPDDFFFVNSVSLYTSADALEGGGDYRWRPPNLVTRSVRPSRKFARGFICIPNATLKRARGRGTHSILIYRRSHERQAVCRMGD